MADFINAAKDVTKVVAWAAGNTRVVFLGIDPNAARFMATHGGFARYGVANQAENVPKAVFAALEDTF